MLSLLKSQSFRSPFPHFISTQIFPPAVHQAILAWLMGEKSWKLRETDFYEQHEFTLQAVSPPPQLAFLTAPAFLTTLRIEYPLKKVSCCAPWVASSVGSRSIVIRRARPRRRHWTSSECGVHRADGSLRTQASAWTENRNPQRLHSRWRDTSLADPTNRYKRARGGWSADVL